MPTIVTRGAASALAFSTGVALGPSTLIAVASYGSGSSASLASLNASVNYFAVVLGSEGTSPPSSAGGSWTSVTGAGAIGLVYTRVLNATDIAAGGSVAVTGGNWALVIYRGPNTLTYQTSDSGSAPVETIPGFPALSGFCGLLATARHYVPGSGGTPGLPTTPVTWVSRINYGNVASDANRRIADRLTPANTAYTGQDIDWTTFFDSIPAEGDEIGIYQLRRL